MIRNFWFDEFFEWLSNKNVCILLPLWWENYPFVTGVKDGEKILLMQNNSSATEENTKGDMISNENSHYYDKQDTDFNGE